MSLPPTPRQTPLVNNPALALAAVLVALATMAAIAIGSVFAVARDLEHVYFLQAELRHAQHLADEALRLQIDEETAVRGFAATRRRIFLEPYFGSEPRYARTLAELRRTLDVADVNVAQADVAGLAELHARWVREIATPWLAANAREAAVDVALQIRGKTYVDRMRALSAQIVDDIERRVVVVQAKADEGFRDVALGAFAAILLVGVAAVVAALRQRRLQESLVRERTIVETLQRAFINRWDSLPNVGIGTAYVSATSEAAVGGDLFDIRRLDARHGYVLIADVSGKGIEAAVDTAFIKYSIRALVRQFAAPDAVLSAFNELYTEARSSKESFVVVFLGIFDFESSNLRYASAGHPAAWLRRGGEVRTLEVTGPLLGVFEHAPFRVQSVPLQAGDLLVLATDGLTEARRPGGDMLTEEGAAQWIGETDDADAQRFVDALTARLRRFIAGRVRDDLAMLALKFKPPAPSDEADGAGAAPPRTAASV